MHKIHHYLLRLCPHSRAEVKTASRKKTTISARIIRNNSNLASETLRGASFNFTEFYKAHKYIEANWLEWFIGFVEGDGGIYTHNGRLSFVITQDESAILYHIKDQLGFGNVRFDKGVQSYRYVVSDLPTIVLLMHLFNGNLVLEHRIRQLALLRGINQIKINKRFQHLAELVHITTSPIISLNDGWLSGITDSEGCFNIHITLRLANTVGFNTKLRFIIDQNDTKALNLIRNIFNTGFVSQRKSNLAAFRYTSSSFKGLETVVLYFNAFPLKTLKKEAFIKWCDIRVMMANKEHLHLEGFTKIRALAYLVNDKTKIND
jgi:LAGLIDADG endonuclease